MVPGFIDSHTHNTYVGEFRYSFDQLDRLNGYASGMPSPDYYQRLWQHVNGDAGRAALDAASRVLVEVGHLTRERDLGPKLSAADEIAALEQARRLARFRGHADGPTRGSRRCPRASRAWTP